jgi:hypothetical protein
LKHPAQPFVVEVKRRFRPGSLEANAAEKDAFSALVRAHSLDSVGKGESKAKEARQFPSENLPVPPVGRILPTLIEGSSTKEALLGSGPPKDRAGIVANKRRRANRAEPVPIGNDESVLAHPASAAIVIVDSSDSSRQSQPTLNETSLNTPPLKIRVSAKGSASAANTRAKRRRRAHSNAVARAVEVAVSETSSPNAAQQSEGVSSPTSLRDRRSIMARYVFRTEIKPGERWKLRLRRRQ